MRFEKVSKSAFVMDMLKWQKHGMVVTTGFLVSVEVAVGEEIIGAITAVRK